MSKNKEALKESIEALKQPEQPELIGVPIQFLQQVVAIIDTAVKRGAFEGKEMQSIGTLRNNTEAVLIEHFTKKEEAEKK